MIPPKDGANFPHALRLEWFKEIHPVIYCKLKWMQLLPKYPGAPRPRCIRHIFCSLYSISVYTTQINVIFYEFHVYLSPSFHEYLNSCKIISRDTKNLPRNLHSNIQFCLMPFQKLFISSAPALNGRPCHFIPSTNYIQIPCFAYAKYCAQKPK